MIYTRKKCHDDSIAISSGQRVIADMRGGSVSHDRHSTEILRGDRFNFRQRIVFFFRQMTSLMRELFLAKAVAFPTREKILASDVVVVVKDSDLLIVPVPPASRRGDARDCATVWAAFRDGLYCVTHNVGESVAL